MPRSVSEEKDRKKDALGDFRFDGLDFRERPKISHVEGVNPVDAVGEHRCDKLYIKNTLPGDGVSAQQGDPALHDIDRQRYDGGSWCGADFLYLAQCLGTGKRGGYPAWVRNDRVELRQYLGADAKACRFLLGLFKHGAGSCILGHVPVERIHEEIGVKKRAITCWHRRKFLPG